MDVLLTSHRFWPHHGGVERVVEALASRIAAAGHSVTVATRAEEGRPEVEARDGYDIRRFHLERVGPFHRPPAEYFRFVKRPDWDVVHIHGQRLWSTDWLYPYLSTLPAPFVFTAHGFYQWHVERRPVIDALYYRHVMPRALRSASAIVALTNGEKEELTGWGVKSTKVRVIPDGVELHEFDALPNGFRERFGIPAGERVLLYVGGCYPNKRVDRLVRLAAKTRCRLVVIGPQGVSAKALDEARRLASALDVHVDFLGTLERADVLSAYRESDLFVLASDFEGFGLVLLEAMAAGLPFVATPAGAARELAATGAGLVAEDEAGLAAAVDGLLADDARRAEMAEAGRRHAQHYSWDRIAEAHVALFEEVCRK